MDNMDYMKILQLIFLAAQFFESFHAACNSPLGMESGAINDSQIDYEKSLAHGNYQYVGKARYNVGAGWCTIGGQSYKPGHFDPNLYLEIELESDHLVTSILLQGKKDSLYHSYGEKLQIQWKKSKEDKFWYFKGPNGRDLVTKNLKNNSAEKLSFEPPLCLKFLRLLPFISENQKCIRLEIIGCAGCGDATKSPETAQPPMTTQGPKKVSTTAPSGPVSNEKTTQSTRSPKTATFKPKPRKKSDSSTVIIVVVVILIIVAVIAAIIAYRFRLKIRLCCRRILENNNGPKAAKKHKKANFHVQMEATYSEVKTDELDRISLIVTETPAEFDDNEQQYGGNYSEVYAAPIINKTDNTEVTTGYDASHLYSQAHPVKNSQDSNIYAPPVNYSQPDTVRRSNQSIEREPIYAGSQIYENPYQSVTASSIYADPGYADPGVISSSVSVKIREFPRNKLNLLEKIGEGQFGEVHICAVDDLALIVFGDEKFTSIDTGINKVAVKMMKSGLDGSAEEEFMKEAKVMVKLAHENVVQLIGICYDEPKCMVVEYMENGDLMQFLQAHRRYDGPPHPRISEIPKNALVNDILFYFAMQIAAGMNYLSSQGFVHRDLATRNCLVGHSYTVKIADFGMSRDLYSKLYYRIEGKAILPIRWMAPESLYFGTFTSHTDVWAFAVTVWEIFIFAAEQPYEQFTDQQVIDNALALVQNERQAFRYLEKANGCPDDTYALLMSCWKRAPEDRPSFGDLLQFFSVRSQNAVEVEI